MSINNIEFKFFADFIEKELGILYPPENYYQLEQRLKHLAEILHLPSIHELYLMASRQGITGEFRQQLLDLATNNETSFFRDPKLFTCIEKHILPTLKSNWPNSFNIRLWCAAASFGQEPYSLAMLVHEFMMANPSHPPFEIIATDIADHALKRCKDGKYSQLEVQRGLDSHRLNKYFTKDEENIWQLKSEIKNKVKFQKQNLLETFFGLGSFHIISCRYVLIYQDNKRKNDIIHRLVNALYPGGYLILGASESALGVSENLESLNLEGVVVYRKKT
jgi:chemotaxis protein methyltransferase CheR